MTEYELQKLFQIMITFAQYSANKDPILKEDIQKIIRSWFIGSKGGTPAERRKVFDLAKSFDVEPPQNWAE